MFSNYQLLISLQILNGFLFIFETSEVNEVILISVNIFISILHLIFVYRRNKYQLYLSKIILIIQPILTFSIITLPHFLIAEVFLQISIQICIIGKSQNIQYDFITYTSAILLIGIQNQLKFDNTVIQIVRFIIIQLSLVYFFIFFINKQKEVQTIINDQERSIQFNNQYSIYYDINLQLLKISDQLKTQIDSDFLQNCIIVQYQPQCLFPTEISLQEILKIIIQQNNEIHLSIIQYTHPICDDYQLKIHYDLVQIQLDFFPTKERDSILMDKYLKTILSQLFSTFSHEFGTALNYISAFSQIGCECGNTETFTEIYNVCQIMHYFVLNLVDFNDIQNNRFSLQVQHIEIPQLLEDIRRLFQKQFIRKGLQLDCYNFSSTSSIISDKRRILQILIQLISNAQKFTLNGSVKITVTLMRQNFIQFSVQDTGIGINDDVKFELQQLFQSNIKQSKKISENTAGFGLGCYLSNLIALQLSNLSYSEGVGLLIEQLNSGTRISFIVKDTQLPVFISSSSNSIQKISNNIYYDNRQNIISSQVKMNTMVLRQQNRKSYSKSQLQVGNYKHQQIISQEINEETDDLDFLQRIKYFCKPQKQKSTTPISLQDIQFSDQFQNNCNCTKILIVDDEMINIIALQLMLKNLNFNSDFCFNGHEALKKIENNLNLHCKYSIIFMDLNMPIMDGFKTTQIIRQKYKHIINIIACTAFSDAQTQIKCQEYGMNHYLNKPVNLNQLFYLMEILEV